MTSNQSPLAVLAEQEALQFAKLICQVTALWNRTGLDSEERAALDECLCDFIRVQTEVLDEGEPVNTDHDDQRAYFNATRGVA